MFSLSGYRRYFWRELYPRALVLLLCTYFLMPHAPGLAFHGSFVAAVCASLFFTAYFSLWGACIMALPLVQRCIASIKSRLLAVAVHTTMIIFIPVPAMLIVVLCAGQNFACTSWYGLIPWIVALNVCCILTHDYGAQ